MNFLRSMFTEGEDNISVGSVCVFLVLVVYAVCIGYAQYTGKPVVVSPGEMAALAGAIYALKKIPPILKGSSNAD